MATLASNKSHSWEKNSHTKLEFSWPDPNKPGDGKVSVKLGDAPAHSYSVPQADIAVDNKAGKLTNNTTKTINYTLS